MLFVCTGNTCRSPMAEALFKHMLAKTGVTDIEVHSRGLSARGGAALSDGAREALEAIGLTPPAHGAKPLERADVEKADRIYAMTEDHLSTLLAMHPGAKGKSRMLAAFDIEDPLGGSRKDYEKCRIDIQNALLDLITELNPEGSSKP